MSTLPVPRLIPILPADRADALDHGRAALDGGAPALLLRAPGMPGGPLLALARALREPCRAHGALLLIADRVDVAAIAGADGVHLPARGLAIAEARDMLGDDGLVGRSCHDAAELRRASDDGADYAFLSPLFETQSHADRPALGVDAFAAAVAAVRVPVLALGGLTPERVPDALRAGAYGVAAISAVFGGDPLRGARRLVEKLC